jgi:hypothetical protein
VSGWACGPSVGLSMSDQKSCVLAHVQFLWQTMTMLACVYDTRYTRGHLREAMRASDSTNDHVKPRVQVYLHMNV